MKRCIRRLFPSVFCLFLLFAPAPEARGDSEPAETLISAAVRSSYPDCRIVDYAPVGPENKEYIVLAVDSAAADKPAVMIVSTEEPAAGVEFRNDRIMENIPPDRDKVRIMDHLADGNPYIEYRNPDGPDFLYVVFQKNEGGRWQVREAQFGDDWHSLYWFRYDAGDRKIHISLLGNDLTVVSDDVINRDAALFSPASVRLYLRDILSPYVQDAEQGQE